jgi:exodeoxyribonuclease VII small subunit
LEELDRIMTALEDGQLSLDDSLALYERGMRLTKRCQEVLDTAELRVQRLRPVASLDDDFGGARRGYVVEDFEADEE